MWVSRYKKLIQKQCLLRAAAAQQVNFWRKRGTPIGAVEVLQMLLHRCEHAGVDQIRQMQQRTWVIDENGASFSIMLKYITKLTHIQIQAD